MRPVPTRWPAGARPWVMVVAVIVLGEVSLLCSAGKTIEVSDDQCHQGHKELFSAGIYFGQKAYGDGKGCALLAINGMMSKIVVTERMSSTPQKPNIWTTLTENREITPARLDQSGLKKLLTLDVDSAAMLQTITSPKYWQTRKPRNEELRKPLFRCSRISSAPAKKGSLEQCEFIWEDEKGVVLTNEESFETEDRVLGRPYETFYYISLAHKYPDLLRYRMSKLFGKLFDTQSVKAAWTDLASAEQYFCAHELMAFGGWQLKEVGGPVLWFDFLEYVAEFREKFKLQFEEHGMDAEAFGSLENYIQELQAQAEQGLGLTHDREVPQELGMEPGFKKQVAWSWIVADQLTRTSATEENDRKLLRKYIWLATRLYVPHIEVRPCTGEHCPNKDDPPACRSPDLFGDLFKIIERSQPRRSAPTEPTERIERMKAEKLDGCRKNVVFQGSMYKGENTLYKKKINPVFQLALNTILSQGFLASTLFKGTDDTQFTLSFEQAGSIWAVYGDDMFNYLTTLVAKDSELDRAKDCMKLYEARRKADPDSVKDRSDLNINDLDSSLVWAGQQDMAGNAYAFMHTLRAAVQRLHPSVVGHFDWSYPLPPPRIGFVQIPSEDVTYRPDGKSAKDGLPPAVNARCALALYVKLARAAGLKFAPVKEIAEWIHVITAREKEGDVHLADICGRRRLHRDAKVIGEETGLTSPHHKDMNLKAALYKCAEEILFASDLYWENGSGQLMNVGEEMRRSFFHEHLLFREEKFEGTRVFDATRSCRELELGKPFATLIDEQSNSKLRHDWKLTYELGEQSTALEECRKGNSYFILEAAAHVRKKNIQFQNKFIFGATINYVLPHIYERELRGIATLRSVFGVLNKYWGIFSHPGLFVDMVITRYQGLLQAKSEGVSSSSVGSDGSSDRDGANLRKDGKTSSRDDVSSDGSEVEGRGVDEQNNSDSVLSADEVEKSLVAVQGGQFNVRLHFNDEGCMASIAALSKAIFNSLEYVDLEANLKEKLKAQYETSTHKALKNMVKGAIEEIPLFGKILTKTGEMAAGLVQSESMEAILSAQLQKLFADLKSVLLDIELVSEMLDAEIATMVNLSDSLDGKLCTMIDFFCTQEQLQQENTECWHAQEKAVRTLGELKLPGYNGRPGDSTQFKNKCNQFRNKFATFRYSMDYELKEKIARMMQNPIAHLLAYKSPEGISAEASQR